VPGDPLEFALLFCPEVIDFYALLCVDLPKLPIVSIKALVLLTFAPMLRC
jgi:hypothetical protein